MPRPTDPSRSLQGEAPTHSTPTVPEHGDNSASTVIESPQLGQPGPRRRLDPHDFPDGGGSGGAEAFRRGPRARPDG